MPSRLDRKASDFSASLWKLGESFMASRDNLGQTLLGELRRNDGHVVFLLGAMGKHTMTALARGINRSVSSATLIVDRLVSKGLVTRVRADDDRRVVRVGLTAKGRALFRLERRTFDRFGRAVLEALEENEQDLFLVLSHKVARRLEEKHHPPMKRDRS